MRLLLVFSILSISILSFSQEEIARKPDLCSYVNPLIGTAKMGHTYPGATVPFGMVQLSPDTDTIMYAQNGSYNKDVYKYCAGYQYSDKTIVGFSHTHFSGTGHSDLGDILIMPTTGKLQLNPGTASDPASGFRSAFSHQREEARPNYYSVELDDHGITAEMTTTERVGFHRYTFPKTESAHIILDLVHGIYNYEGKNVWTFVRIENDSTITGYRQTNGWGRTRTVYFAITFSKAFKSYGYKDFTPKSVYRGFWRKFDVEHNFPEMAAEQLRAYFDFDVERSEQIMMKVALSSVSTENAMENMNTEAPEWNFDRVKLDGQLKWEEELRKIEIEAGEEEKTNFYTALYHTFLSPTIYSDVNGEYRGLDQNVHSVGKGEINYSTFSLWDTYRALHPLLTIIQPSRNNNMVKSMLSHYDQSVHHLLPVWSHHANENWCMIGYHSVPVIADMVMTGTNTFDANRAFEACVTTARKRSYDGLGYYMDMGYVPEDKNGSSVSKTLEYAFDDWCIAQMAKKLGKTNELAEFSKRAQNYKNVFDPAIGFMRPKLSDGTFKVPFDVLNTHGEGFIEGNSWNYSLYVPHDPAAMIAMMGGKAKFSRHLDSLFTMQLPDKYFAETEDISRDGIIGNYVHGNEPSHHAAYLYNWTDTPWKTQSTVRMIMKKMYRPVVDGLGGNDDCGQMSAWYVFSSLGFYPVAPGSAEYAIGSPSVREAVMKFENGLQLRIEAVNQSEKNVYVQKIELDGKKLDRWFLTHEQITGGGTLKYYMGSKPKKL